MINLKVCGITTKKQLQQLEGLNVSFAGFNFDKNSANYAADILGNEDLTGMDLDIKKVGVFVDEDYEDIMEMVEKYELDVVELHGNQSPELCEEISEDVEVIKAFKLDEKTASIDKLVAAYDNVCDYYLFTSNNSKAKFDWKLLDASKIEKPFFLSGAITPNDAAALKAIKHPDFFCANVDANFEKEKSLIDMGLVLKFIQETK